MHAHTGANHRAVLACLVLSWSSHARHCSCCCEHILAILLRPLCGCVHAGKVYHLAEAGALSEAVRPLKPDGSVDADIMARLSVRHDDSLQNVANRLALWDRQVSNSGV
jgi:hypothetical protein